MGHVQWDIYHAMQRYLFAGLWVGSVKNNEKEEDLAHTWLTGNFNPVGD